MNVSLTARKPTASDLARTAAKPAKEDDRSALLVGQHKNISSIRQQLASGRQISDQASSSYASVEKSLGHSIAWIEGMDDDVDSACRDNDTWNTSDAGDSMLSDLMDVQAWRETAESDLEALSDIESSLAETLQTALEATQSLPPELGETWLVRGAILAALREGEGASTLVNSISDSIHAASDGESTAESSAANIRADDYGEDLSEDGYIIREGLVEARRALVQAEDNASAGVQSHTDLGAHLEEALLILDKLRAPGPKPPAPVAPQPPAPVLPPPATMVNPSDGFFHKLWNGITGG